MFAQTHAMLMDKPIWIYQMENGHKKDVKYQLFFPFFSRHERQTRYSTGKV